MLRTKIQMEEKGGGEVLSMNERTFHGMFVFGRSDTECLLRLERDKSLTREGGA